jgi:hypothetical protein
MTTVAPTSSGANDNNTSISLTAGDWDVSAVVEYTVGTGTVSMLQAAISTTSGGNDTAGSGALARLEWSMGSSGTIYFPVGPRRMSLSGTTTVFLVTQMAGTIGTGSWRANGILQARRSR